MRLFANLRIKMRQGMAYFRATLTLLALLGLLAGTVAAQQLGPVPNAQDVPRPCHHHGSKAPASNPRTYVCCDVGHSPALLQLPSFSKLRIVGLRKPRLTDFAHASRPDIVAGFLRVHFLLRTDPPHANVLRV
jgi:hypothetical protein